MKTLALLAFVVLPGLATLPSARGDDRRWRGTYTTAPNTYWSNSINWEDVPGPGFSGPPTAATVNATMDLAGGNGEVAGTGNTSGANFYFNAGNLRFLGTLTSQQVSMNGGTGWVLGGQWNIGGNLTMGVTGGTTSTLRLTHGGSISVAGNLNLGTTPGATGVIRIGEGNFSGGTLAATGGIYLGNSGAIQFFQTDNFTLGSPIYSGSGTNGSVAQAGTGATFLNGPVTLRTATVTQGTLTLSHNSGIIDIANVSGGNLNITATARTISEISHSGGFLTVAPGAQLFCGYVTMLNGSPVATVNGGALSSVNVIVDTVAGATASFVLKNGGVINATGGLYIGARGAVFLGEAGATAGTINGNIHMGAGGTFTFAQNGAFTFANTINGSHIPGGGTGTIIHNGTGTTILTGNNSGFTGATRLTAGTLRLGSAGAIGSTGAISFGTSAGGGILQFSSANTADCSARFSTAAGQGYKFDTNGQDVTLATGLTSVGSTLAKFGAGTLTLTGANTSTGTTLISGGTLQIGNGGTGGSLQSPAITNHAALTINRSDNTIYAGAISGPGTFTKSGTGTLTLTNQNASTGGTTVTAGTLRLAGPGYNVLLGTPLTILAGATVDAAGTVNNAHSIPSLTLQGGTLAGANPDPTYGNFALSGDVTVTGNTTSTISAALSLNSGAHTFTVADGPAATDLLISGAVSSNPAAGTGTGTATLTKAGPGTLTLNGANTYTGATTVSAGTLVIGGSIAGSGGTVQAGASLIVNSGATVAQHSGTFTVNGALTNHGTMRIKGAFHASGATSFVNHGVLDLINATAQLPANFSNGPTGIVLTADSLRPIATALNGTTFTLLMDSYTGHTFRLQRTTDLIQPFTDIGPPQQGLTGTTLLFTDPAAPRRSFYRVLVD